MENQIRFFSDIVKEVFNDEHVESETSTEQVQVEKVISRIYKLFERDASIDPNLPKLRKKVHSRVLNSWLMTLPKNYTCLDASRPWLIYWILHALYLLNDMPQAETLSDIVNFLKQCQHKEGGYGGGPLQHPHLGTTYAAVNALSIIGTDEAYNSIDRSKLQKFLWTLRDVDGSFALHKGGEQDIRGAYCAASVAKLTNIYTDALFDKTAEWVVSCQTYEGGFAGCPGMEAHGGYAFCGIACLALLNRTQLCDVDALLRWSVNRQMRLEGGFQGRTNKLVDGCYSFWQGAILPIISAILSQENKQLIETVLFNQGALQEYIIVCCEAPEGGLVDKPGKPRDIYHTCYTLSGLSVAQHGTGAGDAFVIGSPTNELNRVHPLHNIGPHLVYNAIHYFIRHPPPVKGDEK
ncbi:protein farnesyltransferase subunit beta [Colias croceus]|uniref:protein farnesyltransferase subunit beta n=1 Tax=Colias crocea TaxID=72248 RepID=UPI001E27D1D9|nr:protein farnesyltransferase subunit beta [Colias croceus]XP_045502786.1 protein farnesyltransferase subunit beta [Colias croceus]XP_045502787.1 protein farnesyltransferase subunit beta [Colias croceus]